MKILYIIVLLVVLLIISSSMVILIKYSPNNIIYPTSDPMLITLKKDLTKIDPEIGNLEFYNSGSKSYIEDKNRIYICLFNEKGEYYPYNTLVEVLIHEISHAFTPYDPDHKSEAFINMYKFLIEKAEELKIYDPKLSHDYSFCMVDK
jgi:hypothetical protein